MKAIKYLIVERTLKFLSLIKIINKLRRMENETGKIFKAFFMMIHRRIMMYLIGYTVSILLAFLMHGIFLSMAEQLR